MMLPLFRTYAARYKHSDVGAFDALDIFAIDKLPLAPCCSLPLCYASV